MIADFIWKYNPPFPLPQTQPQPTYIPQVPYVPQIPPDPIQPWPVDRLKEFEDLLRRVKELEDKVGCPCEPDKADYLKILRDRIEKLEKEVNK